MKQPFDLKKFTSAITGEIKQGGLAFLAAALIATPAAYAQATSGGSEPQPEATQSAKEWARNNFPF